MAKYTNFRPSLVYTCGLVWNPTETLDVPDEFVDALEAKDANGKLTHPCRAGVAPYLRPGAQEVPDTVPGPVLDLSDLPEPHAIGQARICMSVDKLAQWYSKERRPAVLNALKQRGKEIQEEQKALASS